MTPDEINRAIAEKVGWRYGPIDIGDGLDVEKQSHAWWRNGKAALEYPPNYSGDLNALHEALQSLTEVELSRYADEVCDLAYDGHHDTIIQTMLVLSAKELAECYVRAIGKWRGA